MRDDGCGEKGTKPMSSNDCNAMFHERRIAARGAVLRSLAVAVMLVSGGSASGCSDGSGADPDAGAMDTGVDGAVDGGADAGAVAEEWAGYDAALSIDFSDG